MSTPGPPAEGWTWVLVDASSVEVTRIGPFASKDQAEVWLSATWEDLADQEVVEVVLEDAGAEVYRMSLGPAGDGQSD